MACSGYCARCHRIHTLPTTPGAVRAIKILRKKILASSYFSNSSKPEDLNLLQSKWWLEEEDANNNDAFDTDNEDNNKYDHNHNHYTSKIDISTICTTKKEHRGDQIAFDATSGKRGKMIGVLEALDVDTNEIIYLAAYAGKFFNHNLIQPGWEKPLVIPESIPSFVESAQDVSSMTLQIEQLEEELSLIKKKEGKEEEIIFSSTAIRTWDEDKAIDRNPLNNNQREIATVTESLTNIRRLRSQRATEGIQALQAAQIVRNFRNESKSLPEIYYYYDYNIFGKKEKKSKKRKSSRQRRRQRQRQQQLEFEQEQEHSGKRLQSISSSTSPLQQEQRFVPPTVAIINAKAESKSKDTIAISPNGMPPLITADKNINVKKTKALPAGIGECAAIRLLNAAATANKKLLPLGIAEMFVGPSGGMSRNRKDGMLYDACKSRCQPILGWMLCGLKDDNNKE